MDIKALYQKLKQSLISFYQQADDFTGGVLEIFRVAIQRFGQERGPEAAAALAYYAFFSIFPMLLAVIAVGSFFMDRSVVQGRLMDLLQGVVPGAETVVVANIEQVLQLRGAVTIFALVSLIWSATGVFNILVRNVNRAFPKALIPDFFKGRLMGFFMVLAIIVLSLLAFAVSTGVGLIPAISIPFNGKALHETVLWQFGSFLVPIGINTLTFWAIYFWVPSVRVSRKASLISGLVAGVAWELTNNAFAWYLNSGLSQYKLVYGSLGTVVALLFWIYLTATIILIGAHLTSSIQNAQRKRLDGGTA